MVLMELKINVIEYLIKTAHAYPNKIAVADEKQEITFSEFKELVEKASGEISYKLQGKKRSPVAVFLPKSANCILMFMAIIASGNIYVPLDAKMPKERLRKILENLSPELIICDDETIEIVQSVNKELKVETVDCLISEEAHRYQLGALTEEIIDTDPAYIIYTSGSTGMPKGVVIPHRGIIDYIEWATKCYDIKESDIIGNQAPFYFDNSTLDIYLCMKTGATLVILPENLFMFPVRLIQYVELKKITCVFWVPSVLINIANTKVLDTFELTNLTKILFAGEVMPNKHLNYWRSKLPNALYSNLYGPTEITVDCTYYIVRRAFKDDEPLPIGSACRNSHIIILNEDDQQCKKMEQGELCVRGSSLALGYWNDIEKSEEVFCRNPLNKNYYEKIYRTGDLVYANEYDEIIYVGRKDNQIKHLGYRIELGEIENAMTSLNEIKKCCVVYDVEKTTICAFYESENEIDNALIRKELIPMLPKYMIPTKYSRLDNMPMNANGKIDRLKVKELL